MRFEVFVLTHFDIEIEKLCLLNGIFDWRKRSIGMVSDRSEKLWILMQKSMSYLHWSEASFAKIFLRIICKCHIKIAKNQMVISRKTESQTNLNFFQQFISAKRFISTLSLKYSNDCSWGGELSFFSQIIELYRNKSLYQKYSLGPSFSKPKWPINLKISKPGSDSFVLRRLSLREATYWKKNYSGNDFYSSSGSRKVVPKFIKIVDYFIWFYILLNPNRILVELVGWTEDYR